MGRKNIDFQELLDVVSELIQNKINFNLYQNIEKEIENIFKKNLSKKELKDIILFLDNSYSNNEIDIDSFNKRLNLRRWNIFKRLKYLIDFSVFSIKEWQELVDKNEIKNYTLIKLHTKSILLANEILVLLRNWYWEGANARWRTLYENIVTTIFLIEYWNNENNLYTRFLEHIDVLNYKEAKIYKNSYKKLNHKWYWKINLLELEKRKNDLIKKYWNDFFKKDYWWISDDITKNKVFREIEKKTDMEHFIPYFKMSSRWVHSSSKSFQNIWLLEEELHLIWPSNIWLTDPLQNTALFILKWTVSILTDFNKQIDNNNIENKIILIFLNKILIWLEKWIWKECLEIEKEILDDEKI